MCNGGWPGGGFYVHSVSHAVHNACIILSAIQGPEGTPYEAGVFRLELELSERCVFSGVICTCAQSPNPLSHEINRTRPPHGMAGTPSSRPWSAS